MINELKTIFENVDASILNEDTLKAISQLVETTVTEKTAARVTLELESALKTQDEDHATKFQTALGRIDADHTAKVKKVVEAINKDHISKLNLIKERYEKIIKTDAVKHRDSLVEAVDQFLNEEVIGKRIPKLEILEAAKNTYTANVLSEARKVLGVDPSFVKANIKSALVDGKNQIDQLAKENVQLKKAQAINESKKILFDRTKNLPVNAARFARERLEGKPASFIKENFEYVMEMYDRTQKQEKRSTLNENKSNVDRAVVADEIIKENAVIRTSNTNSPSNPMENVYLEGLGYRK